MEKQVLLKNIIALAEMMHHFLGRNCEIAIHDLNRLDSSLVHLVGDVTGRTVGAPATDFLIKHMEKYGNNVPDLPPYPTATSKGHPLKSALTFIRDKKGRPVFAICVNYNIAQHMNAIELLSEQIRCAVEDDDAESRETFAATSIETSEAIVGRVLREFGKHPVDLSREERIALIGRFQESGAFRFKGMVERIAEIMGISKFTLYNYRKVWLAERPESDS